MIKKLRAILSKTIFYIGLPLVYLEFKNSVRSYVLVESSGQVLFVKGWFGSQKYKLPGGGSKHGEDPKLTAVRELYEETGIKVEQSDLTQILSLNQKHFKAPYQHLVFRVKLKEQVWPKASKFEIMEAVWLNPAQINSTNSIAGTTEALKTAGFVL